MLRALGQLLFRGGVSVGICAVAALYQRSPVFGGDESSPESRG